MVNAAEVLAPAALLFLGDGLGQAGRAVRLQAGQQGRVLHSRDRWQLLIVVGVEVQSLEPGLVVVAAARVVAQL